MCIISWSLVHGGMVSTEICDGRTDCRTTSPIVQPTDPPLGSRLELLANKRLGKSQTFSAWLWIPELHGRSRKIIATTNGIILSAVSEKKKSRRKKERDNCLRQKAFYVPLSLVGKQHVLCPFPSSRACRRIRKIMCLEMKTKTIKKCFGDSERYTRK